MPLTRTVGETRKVTSSNSVTQTYLQVVSHGVAQQEVAEMRKIAPRVLQGAKFVLHDSWGPGAQALVRWEAEAGGQS
jgi:hypothetical protein